MEKTRSSGAGAAAAVAAFAAATTGSGISAVVALEQFTRWSGAAEINQLLHGCLTVVAAVLAALCAHLALSWLFIAVVRLAGPQSRFGRFSLGALQVIAPRLVRTAVTASATAASIAALGSSVAFAQPGVTTQPESSPGSEQASSSSVPLVAASLGWGAERAASAEIPGSDGGGGAAPPPGSAPLSDESGAATDESGAGADESGAQREVTDLPHGELRIGWDSSGEVASSADAEPSPAVHAASAAAQGRQHTVRPGESLWVIAAESLGSNAAAAEIHALVHAIAQEQSNQIHNPDVILPGQVLTIPMIDGSAPARS